MTPHTHAVRPRTTCRIERRRIPSGITYCLEGQPLTNGDSLEIWTTLGWVRGVFTWEGEPHLPFIGATLGEHLEPFVIVTSSVCRRPASIDKAKH